MDTDSLLRRAHQWAQLCFGEMLTLGVYGDPTHPATLRYVHAERRVDELLQAAQWEQAKAAMDALQATDHDYHTYAAYFDPLCEECAYKHSPEPVYR